MLAHAHGLWASMLQVTEGADGRASFTWTTPAVVGAASPRLQPLVPDTCSTQSAPTLTRKGPMYVARWDMDCAGGLAGQTFGVESIELSSAQVLLRAQLKDGRRVESLLDGEQPRVVIPLRAGAASAATDYVRLGIGHILGGWDHLAFVLGLLLIVRGAGERHPRWWPRLVGTISAFTLGHSITLALATLGWVRLPTAPVEAAIALSIVAIAVELARQSAGRSSILSRRPWLTAAAFGLLHGLGFAGALAEIGLPQEEIPLALLCFNAGIELGQLAFVAAVLPIGAAFGRFTAAPLPLWSARIPAYGIGGLSSYWLIQRLTSVVAA